MNPLPLFAVHDHDSSVAPRILLVDDEPFSRALMRQHLPAEYTITECPDAETALREAKKHPHDAALVDVQMPGLDGFALCRLLRNDPLTANIPVIVVTAKSGIEDLERGFEAGATDYIRKPFNPRELLVRVRNAVELKLRGDAIRGWQERIAHDLALAGALQRSLLAPRPLLHHDMRISTAYQSSIEVGGDLFDMQHLPDGRIALYVADVAGHGVGAALASTFLKASLSEILRAHAGAGPAHIANELHRLFIEQLRAPGLYATLFLALVNPERRRWQCINCGHPAPIVIAPPSLKRRDFEDKGGPPVGFALAGRNPFSEADEINLDLPEDVAILMVTDGLLEAVNNRSAVTSSRKVLSELVTSWLEYRTAPPMEYIFDGMRQAGFVLGSDDCTAMLVEQVRACDIVFEESVSLSAENLGALAQRMEAVLVAHAWPEASVWAAHLLLVEHGANVLRHGRCSADAHLAVQVRLLPNAIELLVTDNGQPWKYEEAPEAEPDAMADHGRGLMMIRRTASYVASHRENDRNINLFGVLRDWTVPE
jgi:sigma-B regulation protein RsbU (phosphoserine phosphatase)